MKTNRVALFHALSAIAPLTGKRSTHPVLNCFLIGATGGRLTIRASDLDSDATEEIECDGDLKPVCVSANKITELVRNGPEQVELSLGAADRLSCVSLGKAEIATLAEKEFPAPINDEFKQIAVNPVDLAEAIRAVAWAAADEKEVSRRALQCIHVVLSATSIKAQASDSRTLASFERSGIAADSEFMLQSQCVSNFCDALERKDASLFLSDGKVKVQYKGGSFTTKLPDSQYPSQACEHIKKGIGDVIGTVDRESLLQSAKTCRMLGSDSKFVICILETDSNGLTCKLRDNTSAFEQSHPGTFKKLSAWIDSKFLIAVLSAHDSDTLEMRGKDGLAAIQFESKGLKTIVMPLNPNANAKTKDK